MTQDELPDNIHDMDADEMIAWLSEEPVLEVPPAHSDFEKVTDKHVRNALLEHFIERISSGDSVDPEIQKYVLGNLQLIVDGEEKKAFAIGSGRDALSYADHRWRSCVVRYLNEQGISQRELSEVIGVSERLISDWIRYARTEVRSYVTTKEFMDELILEQGENESCREMIAVLGKHRMIQVR